MCSALVRLRNILFKKLYSIAAAGCNAEQNKEYPCSRDLSTPATDDASADDGDLQVRGQPADGNQENANKAADN